MILRCWKGILKMVEPFFWHVRDAVFVLVCMHLRSVPGLSHMMYRVSHAGVFLGLLFVYLRHTIHSEHEWDGLSGYGGATVPV